MFSNNISTIVFAVILLVRTSGFLETPLHSRLLLDERSFILHGSTTENEIRIVQKQYNDDFIRQELENMDETTLPRWAKDIVAEARPIRTDHDGVLESSEFPMSLFVDQNLIKKALVLAAVNQRIGGVVIYGGSGTGKSTLIRTMEQLLPKSLDDSISSDTMPPPQNDTETASTPHVTVPLNVMEDALIGSVDIEKSLKAGSPVFSPGLLAKANRGVLYIDDINLLEEEVGSVIMNVLADGYVQVEREGLSLKYPCRPLLLATFNPQEGEVREHLLDRVGISLPVGASEMKIPERVQVVQNVESFLDKTLDNTCLNKVSVEKLKLEDRIVNARKLLPTVEIDHDQMLYLCEEATRADCEGQRAEVFATEIAKASAAFDGRENVNAKDLQVGILLAIAPRARNVGRDVEQSQPERQPPPDQSPPENSNKEEDQSEEDTDPENEKASPEPLSVPEEFMFGVDSVPIDPMLIHLQNLARRGKGGKSSRLFNLKRGRFVKSIFPKANARGRIAIGATLRAAAPYQIIRRKRARARNDKEKLVHIRKDDFRIQRLVRKAGVLVIFVVDASGSMALNRMASAKGAAMGLLKEAYKCRDKICMIAFRGSQAEVVVPPTRSLALTKNRLEAMPCGGNSPLAHALMTALRVGESAIKVKRDVSRAIVVLLTDGRANIPICVSMKDSEIPKSAIDKEKGGFSREYLNEEAIAVAEAIGESMDIDFLCIDTEDRFVGTGISEQLCRAACGTYHKLGAASLSNSVEVSQIARKKLQETRNG